MSLSGNPYLENLFYVDIMGRIRDPKFYYDRDYVGSYLVMAVVKGPLYVCQQGDSFVLQSGECIVMDLRQRHRYYFDEHSPGEILWFHFNGNLCSLLFGDMLPLIARDESILQDIETMQEYHRSAAPDKAFVISRLVYDVLTKVMQKAALRDTEDSFESTMKSFLSAHLHHSLTLEEMAAHAGMSRYGFCKKFKQVFGVTPFTYWNQERIEQAKKLLTLTNESIADIAASLNFYDQSYFANTFRKYTGCTPQQYRKRERGK